MKRILSAIVLTLLSATILFAQNKAALTIICDQSGAQVFVAGRLMGTTSPNLSILLPAGTYPVKVAKAGFPQFDTTVTLPASGATINVTLAAAAPPPQARTMPSTFGLTVNSPGGPNAQVFINGGLQGNAPITVQVAPGTYTVTVRAPGMIEWSQQVQVVNAPVALTPGMQAQTIQLQAAASNAPNAVIILNGAQVATGSYSAALAPGNYSINIRAAGFNEYAETFTLAAPKNIVVALQPQLVSFTLSLPQAFVSLNPQGQPAAPIQAFMDNVPLGASGPSSFAGAATPGQHVFKIVSGGIKIESTLNLTAGKAWTIDAGVGLSAR